LQNRLINSRDGYASNEANVLLWEGENEGRYTYHSGVWVTSNFWQLRSLRTERRSTSTKCNGTMRWMKKISRLIVLSTRRVYDTVVKYSWQLDAETCKWPSYLWFFYIVIEYTNKVKVACTKLVDWNIFASFIRVFLIEQGICELLQLSLNFIKLFLRIIGENKVRILSHSIINLKVRKKSLLFSKNYYWLFEQSVEKYFIERVTKQRLQ